MNISEENFYKRQLKLKDFGSEGQKRLKESSVLVIGVGGLGSPVLMYLAAAGVGKLGIVDFDQVDITNLHRQVLFNTDDIGLPKAKLAKDKIKRINPWIEVKVFCQRLEPDNIESITNGYNLIIDCTDNFKTKFLIHDFSFLNSIDLVQASIYQMEGQLQVFRFSNSELRDRGCFRCLWPEIPSDGCVGTCATSGVMGSVAGIIGSMQSMEAIKLLLSWQGLPHGETFLIDLISLNNSKIKWNKSESCPLCSHSARISSIDKREYIKLLDFEIDLSMINQDDWKKIDIREKSELSDDIEQLGWPVDNRPMSTFNEWKIKFEVDQKYLFFCQKGFRSQKVVQELRDSGIKNVFSLYGGIEAAL